MANLEINNRRNFVQPQVFSPKEEPKVGSGIKCAKHLGEVNPRNLNEDNCKVGDTFEFKGRRYEITDIYGAYLGYKPCKG